MSGVRVPCVAAGIGTTTPQAGQSALSKCSIFFLLQFYLVSV